MKRGLSTPGLRHGSTLVELLIAIGILILLARLTIVAFNPKENLEDAADVKRQEHLRTMIDALYQYQIDHDGQFPEIENHATLDQEHHDICSLTSTIEGELFFCILDNPQRIPLGQLIPVYLAALPHDPKNQEEYETGYQLWLDPDGRIHAFAPFGKEGEGIELVR